MIAFLLLIVVILIVAMCVLGLLLWVTAEEARERREDNERLSQVIREANDARDPWSKHWSVKP